MAETEELSPQQRRHARTKARLRDALLGLSADPSRPLTAAALAREAGVGRNAIYVGHADILGELRDLAARRAAGPEARRRDEQADRDKVRALEQALDKLATQNAGLLRRALEAEELWKRSEERNAQLSRELAKLRAPTLVTREAPRRPGKQD
ncbi:MAG: hypothetical protein EOQ31_21650 [Mesorhizobium sp.]|uniref:hypothetical protein n=1 Tax=Mesorhizobium sp. TaxID=1871066 RepID=UPI000FE613D7|nr:hypothetical protein [Mesorhizobium sp.]RWA88160.1 MAG: hypothetical protein EOQ31_21650 [Mesorhizobium sp.]